MDATQVINDSVLESEEEGDEADQPKKAKPVAKLHVLENDHLPATGEWVAAGVATADHHLRGAECVVWFPLSRTATLFGRECFRPGWQHLHCVLAISLRFQAACNHLNLLVPI